MTPTSPRRLRITGWSALAGALALAAMAPLTPAHAHGVSVSVRIGPPAVVVAPPPAPVVVAPPPVVVVPPPVVVAPPTLVVVPGTPVYYAPAAPYPYYFYGGGYYVVHGGVWFQGPTYRGPWRAIHVRAVPRPILAVPVVHGSGAYKAKHKEWKRWKKHGPPPWAGHGWGRGHRDRWEYDD